MVVASPTRCCMAPGTRDSQGDEGIWNPKRARRTITRRDQHKTRKVLNTVEGGDESEGQYENQLTQLWCVCISQPVNEVIFLLLTRSTRDWHTAANGRTRPVLPSSFELSIKLLLLLTLLHHNPTLGSSSLVGLLVVCGSGRRRRGRRRRSGGGRRWWRRRSEGGVFEWVEEVAFGRGLLDEGGAHCRRFLAGLGLFQRAGRGGRRKARGDPE